MRNSKRLKLVVLSLFAVVSLGVVGCQSAENVASDVGAGGSGDSREGVAETGTPDAGDDGSGEDAGSGDAGQVDDTGAGDGGAGESGDSGMSDGGMEDTSRDAGPPSVELPDSCTTPTVDPAVESWLKSNDTCLGEGTRLFDDTTLTSGTAFTHRFPKRSNDNHDYGRQNGGGAALNDFNNDGHLDLYVTNGNGPNRLLMNRGNGEFLDCTGHAGLGFKDDWAVGVTAADYDNDGDQDLYLANTGEDRLLQNNGDLTFSDVTKKAGLDGLIGRSSQASWSDLDGDGQLDLFVASLGEFGVGIPAYKMGGASFPSHLFRNKGDGTFEEVSSELAGAETLNKAAFFGAMADLDGDGDDDIFYAVEFGQNQAFRNDGPASDGWIKWTNVTGRSQLWLVSSPMGVDYLDVNDDGLFDVVMTNLWGVSPQREALMLNQGQFQFVDAGGAMQYDSSAMIQGRNTPVVRAASWAVNAFDYENDGDEDLHYVYGQILPSETEKMAGIGPDMMPDQRNAFLEFDNGKFEVLDGTCVEDRGMGRGAVVGDIDGDGCVDMYVINQEGGNRLFINRCRNAGNWIGIDLVGTASNRDGIGARVTLKAGGDQQVEPLTAGSRGVHSSMPKWLHFGIGSATKADSVEIRWPSGTTQTVENLAAGKIHEIRESK